MTGTLIAWIVVVNVALYPPARTLARWMIARELRRDLRRDLDRWGSTDRR